jgi:hypothetical protein
MDSGLFVRFLANTPRRELSHRHSRLAVQPRLILQIPNCSAGMALSDKKRYYFWVR